MTAGEPYYFPGCTSPAQCVLPNAVIPKERVVGSRDQSSAIHSGAQYSKRHFFHVVLQRDAERRQGRLATRCHDALGDAVRLLFSRRLAQNNPYPVAQGGANVPGFNALNSGRAQLLSLGDTKTSARPPSTNFASASCAMPRIWAVRRRRRRRVSRPRALLWRHTPESCPYRPRPRAWKTSISTTSPSGRTPTSLSRSTTHFNRATTSRKSWERTRSRPAPSSTTTRSILPDAQLNGSFIFYGSETGVDFADFLLGIPSQYNQSQLQLLRPQ